MTLRIESSFLWNETVWNPSMISTALWLDAADASTVTTVSGAISQWNDKSRNNFHATQATQGNRPVYTSAGLNGKNVASFTSPSFLVCTPTSYTSDNFTLYVVARATNYDQAFPNDAGIFSATVNGANLMYFGGGTFGLVKGGTTSVVQASISSAGPHIGIIGRSGGNAFASVNGNTPSLITNYQAPTASTSINIGRLGNVSTMYLNGYIAELLLVNSYDAAAHNSKLCGYLAHKWGLDSSLPSDHPYKNYGPKP